MKHKKKNRRGHVISQNMTVVGYSGSVWTEPCPMKCLDTLVAKKGWGQICICICRYRYKYSVFVFVFDEISIHVFVFGVFDKYVFKYTFFLGPAFSKHKFMEQKITWIFPIKGVNQW